jgi:RecB family endonuclease NucS
MLLKVDPKTQVAERIHGEKLQSFNITERDLQNILFRTLDRLLYDEELLLIMQSRNWQEEPDLMALDKDGRLYIFELKAWESRSVNILQVLRYGQMYGSSKYEELNIEMFLESVLKRISSMLTRFSS